jgi:hypothetical protein
MVHARPGVHAQTCFHAQTWHAKTATGWTTPIRWLFRSFFGAVLALCASGIGARADGLAR